MERGEKKESKQAEKPLDEIARETRRRIDFLRRKPVVDQRDVYRLFKRFFQQYLRKDYEFTIDELRHEIHCIYLQHSVRERIDDLLERLSLIEYTNVVYSREELRALLDDFATVVRSLVAESERRESFIRRMLRLLFPQRPERPIISEFPAIEVDDPLMIELRTLAEEIYASLDRGKVRGAARRYQELIGKYNALGPSAQQNVYHLVHEAYKAIKAHS
ncbi:hypothetical protein D6789_01215 [Candidatus Woesearchaeota archaeon]|nr:MAG: hypothetical protein D6789_01215 [Candidatus Woesearchaeota archaeon]